MAVCSQNLEPIRRLAIISPLWFNLSLFIFDTILLVDQLTPLAEFQVTFRSTFVSIECSETAQESEHRSTIVPFGYLSSPFLVSCNQVQLYPQAEYIGIKMLPAPSPVQLPPLQGATQQPVAEGNKLGLPVAQAAAGTVNSNKLMDSAVTAPSPVQLPSVPGAPQPSAGGEKLGLPAATHAVAAGAAKSSKRTGRWSEQEKALFLQGFAKYSQASMRWKKMSSFVGTRTAVQCKSHHQKLVGGGKRSNTSTILTTPAFHAAPPVLGLAPATFAAKPDSNAIAGEGNTTMHSLPDLTTADLYPTTAGLGAAAAAAAAADSHAADAAVEASATIAFV